MISCCFTIKPLFTYMNSKCSLRYRIVFVSRPLYVIFVEVFVPDSAKIAEQSSEMFSTEVHVGVNQKCATHQTQMMLAIFNNIVMLISS